MKLILIYECVFGEKGLQITEKVFAKLGINWTKGSISTNRSECFFRGTKLQKICGTKNQERLNATNSSIKYSTPPFANNMLAVVFIYKLFYG